MASIQQSYNSLFGTALAAAVTGSHAFRQSAMGQQLTEKRSLLSKIKQTEKAQGAYQGRPLSEMEIQQSEKLGEQRQNLGLQLTALTGNPSYAKEGLTIGTETRVGAEEEREKNVRAQQAAEQAQNLTPSELAEGRAAAALSESIMQDLARYRYRGGN